ncbi:MAG: hypothetical protein ACRD4P_14580 [Bryobacteraceae bacterium]
MSTIRFTRSRRREMQKLANLVDRVTQTDRRFFERFPHRKHRVRLASQAEIAQHELLDDKPIFLPEVCRIFTVVRNIAPGARLRMYVRGLEGSETDLDEATALAIFEASATPKTLEIEAAIKKSVETRNAGLSPAQKGGRS